nr:hypothetical protein L203_00935 [Cryptococcus depauperatus CBS 7841]
MVSFEFDNYGLNYSRSQIAQSVTARDANVSKSTDHSQKSCQTTIDLKRQNLLASISKNETQLVHLCDCRPLPAISSNSQFLTTFPLIQISTTRFCPRPFSVRMSDLPNPALFTSLTRLPAPPTYARLYDRPVSPSIGDTPPVTLLTDIACPRGSTIILSQQAYVAQKTWR